MPAPFRRVARVGSEPVERGTGAARFCRCDDPAAGANEPGRRISSHRTTQGHIVYYRCDCGLAHMTLMTWSRDAASGSRRLR